MDWLIIIFLIVMLIWWITKSTDRDNSKGKRKTNYVQKREKYAPGEWIVTSVAGVTFENRQEIIKLLDIVDNLYLQREPKNPYDPNAIMVRVSNNHKTIGYIEKKLAEKIAPLIDCFEPIPYLPPKAKIIEFTNRGTDHQGVKITFCLPDENSREADELFHLGSSY